MTPELILTSALSLGGSFFAIVFTLLRSSAARNISEIDARLEKMMAVIEATQKELMAVLLAVQEIKSSSMGVQRDIGIHQARLDKLEDKIAGLNEFWKERFTASKPSM